MNIRPFRFWCYKVLPLVYDDSLSYYEILCKVVKYINEILEELETSEKRIDGLDDAVKKLREYVEHYFDNLDVQSEINNKLDAMAESGELDELFADWINSGLLVDQCDAVVIGQMFHASSWDNSNVTQGFVMFEHTDGKTYAWCARQNGNTDGWIQVKELAQDANGKWNEVSDNLYQIANLGHGNGMTYCTKDHLVYVACGGGANSIAQLIAIDPLTMLTERVIDYHTNPLIGNYTNIAWNEQKEVFYMDGNNHLYELDYDFNVIRSVPTAWIPKAPRGSIVGQSSFTDGKYWYYICQVGSPANINLLCVRRCSDFSIYKYMIVMVKGEGESGCYFKGHYYFSKLSNRIGMIYEIFPYQNSNLGNFKYRSGVRSFMLPDAENNEDNDLYCDFDYRSFRVDGTASYPYASMHCMIDDAIYRMDSVRLDLHIAGDQPYDLNVKKSEGLQIEGYVGLGGQTPTVRGIYIANSSLVRIYNLKSISPLDYGDGGAFLYLTNIGQFRVQGCTFGDLETASAHSAVIAYANGRFVGNEFSGNCSESTVKANFGGDITFDGTNTYPAGYDMYVNERCWFEDVNLSIYNQTDAYSTHFLNSPQNFDISTIKHNGNYYITGSSTTVVNTPASIVPNFAFNVRNISGQDATPQTTGHNLVIYEGITTGGVYFKAILVDNNLKWYDITGTLIGEYTVG